ncbi:hypothetical protein JCM10296v2_003563 [Rhodotorula toruloides]
MSAPPNLGRIKIDPLRGREEDWASHDTMRAAIHLNKWDNQDEVKASQEAWDEKNSEAYWYISLNVAGEARNLINEATSAFAAWNILKQSYGQISTPSTSTAPFVTPRAPSSSKPRKERTAYSEEEDNNIIYKRDVLNMGMPAIEASLKQPRPPSSVARRYELLRSETGPQLHAYTPEEDREIWRLHVVEELTSEEVGEEIGTGKISVKNRWQRTKHKH